MILEARPLTLAATLITTRALHLKLILVLNRSRPWKRR